MGFPKIWGRFLGIPINKNNGILGSMFGLGLILKTASLPISTHPPYISIYIYIYIYEFPK